MRYDDEDDVINDQNEEVDPDNPFYYEDYEDGYSDGYDDEEEYLSEDEYTVPGEEDEWED